MGSGMSPDLGGVAAGDTSLQPKPGDSLVQRVFGQGETLASTKKKKRLLAVAASDEKTR